jgi:hypothetical protein
MPALLPFDAAIVIRIEKHALTRMKLGGKFTVAGFIWIIISMIMFVTVIFTATVAASGVY